jgi:hypothetical protein
MTTDERLDRIDGRLVQVVDAITAIGDHLLTVDRRLDRMTTVLDRLNESLVRGFTWRDEQWLELVRRVEALEAKP